MSTRRGGLHHRVMLGEYMAYTSTDAWFDTPDSPTRPVNGLLPPFSSQHVHLPTPLRWACPLLYLPYRFTVARGACKSLIFTHSKETWYAFACKYTNFTLLTALVILVHMDSQVHATLLPKVKCEYVIWLLKGNKVEIIISYSLMEDVLPTDFRFLSWVWLTGLIQVY
jgi:hypothetical protein